MRACVRRRETHKPLIASTLHVCVCVCVYVEIDAGGGDGGRLLRRAGVASQEEGAGGEKEKAMKVALAPGPCVCVGMREYVCVFTCISE